MFYKLRYITCIIYSVYTGNNKLPSSRMIKSVFFSFTFDKEKELILKLIVFFMEFFDYSLKNSQEEPISSINFLTNIVHFTIESIVYRDQSIRDSNLK